MKLNLKNFSASPTFKILLIAFLILLLLIPMSMVESVIGERSNLYRMANNEITGSWSGDQVLSGPFLSMPFMQNQSKGPIWVYQTRHRHIKPDKAVVDVRVDTQIRYRGIYEVPVYTAYVNISGFFRLNPVEVSGNTEEYKLEEGLFQIPFKYARAIRKPIAFSWNGEKIKLIPRKDPLSDRGVVFTAKLKEQQLTRDKDHQFNLALELMGNGSITFLSPGRQSELNMTSNWVNPSFFGRLLPANYEISGQGFTSRWVLSDLLRNIDNDSSEFVSMEWFKRGSTFGVKFLQPVDTYQIVTRATKYAVLFLALTFLVYFLIEIVSKIKLHPIQYLLVGFANCIFYMLLLSLAEHISFNVAYTLSAAGSVILISLYSFGIIGDRVKAVWMFLILSALYIYLFITLKSQDYALLFGSVGLFTTLALVMYLTRRISWYRLGSDEE